MRALVPVLLLVTLAARGACIDPFEVAAGPRTIQAQCSWWSADVAAEGSLVVGAWMTSNIVGVSRPYSIGRTFGGMLDARGRPLSAEQLPMNAAPGVPSVATNGQVSLLAWSHSGYGTFAQFLQADGARMGGPVQVSASGMSYAPPRALWNGREWNVVLNEGTDVVSLRVEPDGTVGDRKLVAANATLAAAKGDFVVVLTGAGLELITPAGTQPLPGIPAGAVVAIGDEFLAWHAGTIGVQRLPSGSPVTIANAASDTRRIVAAGDVVLWTDGSTVRGASVNGEGRTRTIAPVDGWLLHAAAATPEGVVALLGGTCSTVTARFLPHGAPAFEEPVIVSRAAVPQTPKAVVAVPRGHQVFWSEDRPIEGGAHLFVTQVEGYAARPPVALSTKTSTYSAVAAVPLADGSVVAWAEYGAGQAPAAVKYARIEGEGRLRGAPVEIGTASRVLDIAVATHGEEIAVFTLEHASIAWIGELWKTTIDPGGAVTRVQLEPDVDGWALSAATMPEGVAASWYDYVGTAGGTAENGAMRLTVRDTTATRVFPMPYELRAQRLIGGTTPLVLWRAGAEVHALFPRSGVDVLALGGHLARWMDGVQQSDGSFEVAVLPEYDETTTRVLRVHVTQAGVVTPREEVCFGVPAWLISMRGATVDAVVTRNAAGGVFLAKRPPPRRRAVR